MNAQIIEKHGKPEFVIIPYDDYIHMQNDLEDYRDLRDLRNAKENPDNQQGRSFEEFVTEIGLLRNKS
ncbi:hypothetical protein TI05_12310 [Achromatium sp. WMS3]|nr:hypothetical protein TI05_12310 [Achromatium sp. WMS3]